jgi:transcriptional regulator with XRE-family HTH domain
MHGVHIILLDAKPGACPLSGMESALKTYRTDAGLTLVQFAELVGVAHTTVMRWESGAVKIDPARALQIHHSHGIPLATLRPDLWQDAAA